VTQRNDFDTPVSYPLNNHETDPSPAFDFGKRAGVRGTFDGSRLSIARPIGFQNDRLNLKGTCTGTSEIPPFKARIAGARETQVFHPPPSVRYVGWDYGLLDKDGDLLGNPYHYRDRRTEGMFEKAFERMPKEQIFARTGVAFQPFNTLFQLLAMRLQKPELLDIARTLLMMPDLLAYALTGVRGTEYTDASTSHCSMRRHNSGARTFQRDGPPRSLHGDH
jgi:hypothetical protein